MLLFQQASNKTSCECGHVMREALTLKEGKWTHEHMSLCAYSFYGAIRNLRVGFI
jgi:hypothetical protein